MKNLLVVAAMTMTFNVMANDVDTAEELFALRGENVANAQKAANIYGDLAAASADQAEKAELFYKQSAATYYVGTKAKSKNEKKRIHEIGYEQAKKAINILKTIADGDDETLALAHFYYGANLGKYGEAKGIIASLSRVGELKEHMAAIKALDMVDVEEYGANRILGRLFFKVPGAFGGDKDKSEELLADAVAFTLSDDETVSVHGLNNLYYAETLEANGKKTKACEILKNFMRQDPETLLDTRVPETKEEINAAKQMADDFNC